MTALTHLWTPNLHHTFKGLFRYLTPSLRVVEVDRPICWVSTDPTDAYMTVVAYSNTILLVIVEVYLIIFTAKRGRFLQVLTLLLNWKVKLIKMVYHLTASVDLSSDRLFIWSD